MKTILFFLAFSAWAQNGSQFRDWRDPGDARLAPKTACAGLRSLTGYEFSVITATVVPATA
ncbi:MAG: hypothetical protein ACRD96_16470, partial [Bryobacteraceae bacterium]